MDRQEAVAALKELRDRKDYVYGLASHALIDAERDAIDAVLRALEEAQRDRDAAHKFLDRRLTAIEARDREIHELRKALEEAQAEVRTLSAVTAGARYIAERDSLRAERRRLEEALREALAAIYVLRPEFKRYDDAFLQRRMDFLTPEVFDPKKTVRRVLLIREALAHSAPEAAPKDELIPAKGSEYGWTGADGVPHYGVVTGIDSRGVCVRCHYHGTDCGVDLPAPAPTESPNANPCTCGAMPIAHKHAGIGPRTRPAPTERVCCGAGADDQPLCSQYRKSPNFDWCCCGHDRACHEGERGERR